MLLLYFKYSFLNTFQFLNFKSCKIFRFCIHRGAWRASAPGESLEYAKVLGVLRVPRVWELNASR
jgi:hypothetical protein